MKRILCAWMLILIFGLTATPDAGISQRFAIYLSLFADQMEICGDLLQQDAIRVLLEPELLERCVAQMEKYFLAAAKCVSTDLEAKALEGMAFALSAYKLAWLGAKEFNPEYVTGAVRLLNYTTEFTEALIP